MGFSEEKKESFNKFFKEVSRNGFKNINKRDEKGETVLHHAVENSDHKTVRLLIEKGAEINARDKNGYTPLHCAVFAKSLENVKVLLRSGAEINATQYVSGCTPLHSACKIGGAGVEIIKELVKAGSEVNQLNKYGSTPMYYIWESEKYCLCDREESEKASKFLRAKGGVTKSRKLTCYGIEGLVGEIADKLDRSYMPELKIMEIEEIRKRDKSLIKKECQNLATKIMCQVNEMIDEVVRIKKAYASS
ncbi:ankyrin repeat domain-containing protein [Wolbachia pipientis]